MSTPSTASRPKIAFLIPRGIEAKAQQVYRALRIADAPPYSAWLLGIVLAECDRLEATRNEGKPWPAVSAERMRRAGFGRGRRSGADTRTVTVYPSPAEAGRIRGTAVGMKMPMTDLVSEAVFTYIDGAPRAETGGSIAPGRPLKPADDEGEGET